VTARDATVTLYGIGVYAADSLLIGVGSRGQDAAILLVDVPALLIVLWWFRPGAALSSAALVGVLSFYAYYYVCMTFGTAQIRLSSMWQLPAAPDSRSSSAPPGSTWPRSPEYCRPGRGDGRWPVTCWGWPPLWWPLGCRGPSLVRRRGHRRSRRSVYQFNDNGVDLGLVAPVAVLAGVQLLRGRPLGFVLTYVLLVINVCIGVVLVRQGLAQLVFGVPMTVGEIVGKMLTFAVLTVVAGGLLLRMGVVGGGSTTRAAGVGGGRQEQVMKAVVVYESIRQHEAGAP
jgi:hypothetical protein